MAKELTPVSPDEIDESRSLVGITDSDGVLIARETGSDWSVPQGHYTCPLEGQSAVPRMIPGGLFARQIYYRLKGEPTDGRPIPIVTKGEFEPIATVYPNGMTLRSLLDRTASQVSGVGMHYMWSHEMTESMGDDEAVRQTFLDRLLPLFAQTGFEIELLGFRRRYLMQFSPGSHTSQTVYRTIAPVPSVSPFNDKGQLSSRYRDHFPPELVNEKMRESRKTPWPLKWSGQGSVVRPLLYKGPAWVLRFMMDGQNVLQGNRVFVTDEAAFICSDWCQRHDYTTYGTTNWQSQQFDLPTWINVGLVKRQIRNRIFVPKTVKIEHYALRDLVKNPREVGPEKELLYLLQDRLLEWDIMGKASPIELQGTTWEPFSGQSKVVVTVPTIGNNLKAGTELTVIAYEAGIAWWEARHQAQYASQYMGGQTAAAAWNRVAKWYGKIGQGLGIYGAIKEFRIRQLEGAEPNMAEMVELWRPLLQITGKGDPGPMRQAGVDEADVRVGRLVAAEQNGWGIADDEEEGEEQEEFDDENDEEDENEDDERPVAEVAF